MIKMIIKPHCTEGPLKVIKAIKVYKEQIVQYSLGVGVQFTTTRQVVYFLLHKYAKNGMDFGRKELKNLFGFYHPHKNKQTNKKPPSCIQASL